MLTMFYYASVQKNSRRDKSEQCLHLYVGDPKNQVVSEYYLKFTKWAEKSIFVSA